MEGDVDVPDLISRMQKLIFSLKDLSVENECMSSAEKLNVAVKRSTEEFVKRQGCVDGKVDDGKNIDQKLRQLKDENRVLRDELETILAATRHMQESHRLVMQQRLAGHEETESRSGSSRTNSSQISSNDSTIHPESLGHEHRQCDNANRTEYEESQLLKALAEAVYSIVADAHDRAKEVAQVCDRMTLENAVMRDLLCSTSGGSLDEAAKKLTERRERERESLKTIRKPSIHTARKANEQFESAFWAEHNDDREKIEAMRREEMEEKRRVEEKEQEEREEAETRKRRYMRAKNDKDTYTSADSSVIEWSVRQLPKATLPFS